MTMAKAKIAKIKEQIINDRATGLMLIFGVTPSGESRLQLVGDTLPFGNRDFQFNADGELVGTGTGTGGCGILEESEDNLSDKC